MFPGLSGSLLSHYFAEHLLASTFSGQLGEDTCHSAHRQFAVWWRLESRTLGPASSVRTIHDKAVAPVARLLGFEPSRDGAVAPDVSLVVGLWTDDLDTLWRSAVRAAAGARTGWCLCTNGHQLRLVDAKRDVLARISAIRSRARRRGSAHVRGDVGRPSRSDVPRHTPTNPR